MRVHILSTLFVCVWEWWCPSHNVLRFCFVCLRLVYFILTVSLDCPFWLPLRYSFFLLNRELRDSRFPSFLNSYYTSECKCEIVCKDFSAFLTLSRQKTWRPLVIIASKTNYMKLPSICLAGQNKTCEVLYINSSFLMEPIPWPPLPFVKILYDVFETHYKDSSFLLIGWRHW